MNKYAVPYLVAYDNLTRYWEVNAMNKADAREKAVEQLSTDEDVKRIGKVSYIVTLGKAEK